MKINTYVLANTGVPYGDPMTYSKKKQFIKSAEKHTFEDQFS